MTHMMRRMCWQQLRFSPTMMGKWRITVLGKLVLSPPIKGTFRIPIDYYLKKGILRKRVGERNWFSILKKDEAEDLLC